jgi:riboflavin synthase
MFTGIIESIGTVHSLNASGKTGRLEIEVGKMDMSDVQLGDSIAVNGVCLTAIAFNDHHFSADVSNETLQKTSLGGLVRGGQVNLEKALTPTTRLGGHLVSGHVDGVGEVTSIETIAETWVMTIRAPDELARYIAVKGSITVDGTSLTVNKVNGAEFELTIVPHTLQETIISEYRKGSKINLEVDLIARYLERLILGEKAAEAGAEGVTLSMLESAGLLHR